MREAIPAAITHPRSCVRVRVRVDPADAGTQRTAGGMGMSVPGIRARVGASAIALITLAALVPLAAGTAPAQAAGSKRASVVLDGLKVKGERSQGYDRELFRHWIDADKDGCDAREEVLLAESQVQPARGPGCSVRGRWFSAYDAVLTTDPSTFDVDHVVALAEAWASGARRWDARTREAFANDLGYAGSLIAVSASSNRAKSDSDPAEWLPPVRSYWCTYATTWIAVKYRWRLAVDRAERSALKVLITSCGDPVIALPPRATVTLGAGGNNNGGGGSGGSGDAVDPRFPTCTAAIAAGYGPYYQGVDPEYDWYIDRDGDGIVCE